MKNNLIEYYNIYNEFYSINKYRELKSIVHHGNNRLNHIMRVSKLSFYLSKMFSLDYISCTRGALMHDFFVKEDITKKKYNSYLKKHPLIALKNSKRFFDVNEVEEDIIKTHMFPLTFTIPKYKESKIVCLCDKIVSIYEFLKYEINSVICLFILFVINYIKINLY